MMFKVDDVVVYNQYVCKIMRIKHNDMNGIDYYVMNPIDDESLIIDVPVENRLGNIKGIMSKEEAEELIKKIPSIEILDVDDKYIEMKYKELMSSGRKEDLVTIIKTTYLRNDNRINTKKKISEKDNTYFRKAENLLYRELSFSLGMSYDEVKEYIVNYCNQN